MSAMTQVRRFIALLCLVMVVLAALAPGSVSLPPAILIPFYFFIAIAAILVLLQVDEQSHVQRFPALSAFSPRPPPAQ